jgi:hypothetical protein
MGYGNRFANFYRAQYVIFAAIALLILLGFYAWDSHERPERMRRNALEHCLVDCVLEQTDEITEKQCKDSCHNKYGEL